MPQERGDDPVKRSVNTVSVTLWANRSVIFIMLVLVCTLPLLLDWYCQFRMLLELYREGRPVSLTALQSEFSPAEMSHLSSLAEQYRDLISDQVVQDCAAVIRNEYEKTLRTGEDALMAAHARLRDKKRYGG